MTTSTSNVERRATARTTGNATGQDAQSSDRHRLSVRYLSQAISRLPSDSARQRLTQLQAAAQRSGGTYSQLERDMISRLTQNVAGGGSLDQALAGEMVALVNTLASGNPRGELFENQRQIAFLLLDAIGSDTYNAEDVRAIMSEFKTLSTDADGFTERDAQRIRDLLAGLKPRDAGAGSGTGGTTGTGGTGGTTGTGGTGGTTGTGGTGGTTGTGGTGGTTGTGGTGGTTGTGGTEISNIPAVTGQVNADLIRYASDGAGKHLGKFKLTNKQHSYKMSEMGDREVRLSSVPPVLARFRPNPDGTYRMEMKGTPGPGPVTTGWVPVPGKHGANDKVSYGQSYQLEAGLGAAGSYSSSGAGGGGGGQLKLRVFTQLQIREDVPDGKWANQVRIRFTLGAGTAQIGASNNENNTGATTLAPVSAEVGRVELRFGKHKDNAAPPGDGVRTAQEGEVILSAALNPTFSISGFINAAGDESELGANAAKLSRANISVGYTHSFDGFVKKGLYAVAEKIDDKAPRTGKGRTVANIASGISRGLGNFFPNALLSGVLSGTFSAERLTTAGEEQAGSSGPATTFANRQPGATATAAAATAAPEPTEGQIEAAQNSTLSGFQDLITSLSDSGIGKLIDAAGPVVAAAGALPDIAQLFTKKGRKEFALDMLSPEQNSAMTEKVVTKAFSMALEASTTPDENGAVDPKNSLTRLEDESAAGYAARVGGLITKNLAAAAAEVLKDPATWESLKDIPGDVADDVFDYIGNQADIAQQTADNLDTTTPDWTAPDLDTNDDPDRRDATDDSPEAGRQQQQTQRAEDIGSSDQASGDRLTPAQEAQAAGAISNTQANDPDFVSAYAARLEYNRGNVPEATAFAARVTELKIDPAAALFFADHVNWTEAADAAFMGKLTEFSADAAPPDALAQARAWRAGVLSGPTPQELSLAQSIVRDGSSNDALVNADELRDGVEAQNVEPVFDDAQTDILVSAYDGNGDGALSEAEVAYAIHDGALLVDQGMAGINTHAALTTVADAAAMPTTGTLPGQGNDQFAANVAGRVIGAGSQDDGYANRKELEGGFSDAGFKLDADSDVTDRLIATYGRSGSGALNAGELSTAIRDGAVMLGEDGTVTINTAVLQSKQAAGAANIAGTVVIAGGEDGLADRGNLEDGFDAAGYDFTASDEDVEWLAQSFGKPADGGKLTAPSLTEAILGGAVRISENGDVVVNRAATTVVITPNLVPNAAIGGGGLSTGTAQGGGQIIDAE